MNPVLIDTSVWIEHFHGHHAAVRRRLYGLLRGRQAAINPIIRMEILTGAKDDDQYEELDDTLTGLIMLPITERIYRQAERLRYDMRRQGSLIPVPDMLIAASAISHRCRLLHLDDDFDRIARHAPRLKIAPL